MLLFVILTNLFPQRIIATFEPDFLRVFQKYEQPVEAIDIDAE
jgi:hypothetical protein